MSDEPPPALRLKPRVRTELDAAAPALPVPPAPTEQPPATDSPELPRLRLKPKLTPSVEGQSQPTPASPPDEETPKAEAPKLIRLRPSLVPAKTVESSPPLESPPQSLVQPPPPSSVVAEKPAADVSDDADAVAKGDLSFPPPVTPPPLGTMEWLKTKPSPADRATTLPPPPAHEHTVHHEPPPIPHLRAKSEIADDAPTSTEEAGRGSGLVKKLVSVAAIVAVSVGAFIAFRLYKPGAPKAPPPPAKVAHDIPKPGPTPSETMNALASAPARAIAKAQDAVAAANSAQRERMDPLLEKELATIQRQPTTTKVLSAARPEVAKPSPTAVKSTSQLAPGVTATTSSDIAGEASEAFRTWVGTAKISGLFQGSPARALINGRMVRAGQVADEGLAILFDRLEPDSKTIVFRDGTGATVSRKF